MILPRIAVTGPESSGKTTLAAALASELDTVFVPEFARQYLSALERPYTLADLEIILRNQLLQEELQLSGAKHYLICDTDPLVVKIWAEERFGRCPAYIQQQFENHQYRLRVLCGVEIPWQPDPLRENPHDRDRLHELYRKTLQTYEFPYIEVTGSVKQRVQRVLEELKGVL